MFAGAAAEGLAGPRGPGRASGARAPRGILAGHAELPSGAPDVFRGFDEPKLILCLCFLLYYLLYSY